MKGKLEYKITVDTSEVLKKVNRLTEAIETANNTLQKAQDIVNSISQMQVTVSVAEKKKKHWWGFLFDSVEPYWKNRHLYKK